MRQKSLFSCFYDVALWNNLTAGALDRFRSAYLKCIKVFFRYTTFYSATAMLTELNLHKFDNIIDKNVEVIFNGRSIACGNDIV